MPADDETRSLAQKGGEARTRARRLALVALYATIVLGALAALGYFALEAGPASDARVVGLGALYVLALAALVAYVERDGAAASVSAFHVEPEERSALVLGLVALAAAAPLLLVAPYLSVPPASFGADLRDAALASEIARGGLSRGWVAAPLSGLPLGVYEPVAIPVLIRALVAAGLSPLGATHLLGVLATALTPLSAFVAGVRAHVRPMFALVGALVCAWASNGAAHEASSFLASGHLRVVLALPICLLAAGEIAGARTRAWGALLAVAATLLDPGLALATLVVLSAAGLASVTREVPRAPLLLSSLRALVAASLIGAALHGHAFAVGLAPPGAPPPSETLEAALEGLRSALTGALLDAGRAPVLTYAAGAALLALAVQIRRPAARGAIVGAVVAIAFPIVAAPTFSLLGEPAASIALVLLAPAHASAIATAALAAAIAIALEESAPRLEQLVDALAPELDRALEIGATMALALVVGLAFPHHLDEVARRQDDLMQRRVAPCGAPTPDGYDGPTLAAALRALEGGRLVYASGPGAVAACMERDALVLESGVPVATPSDAHLRGGAAGLALAALEPSRDGASVRAAALGVRHVVERADVALAEGWSRGPEIGGFVIGTSSTPTSLVGAGCVTHTWRGSEAALGARLQEMLATPEGTDRLLAPARLVALDARGGSFVEEEGDASACDPERATIEERSSEVGALEADVVTATPIVLVLRVAWFPSWGVLVDGAESRELVRLAPGFLGVRLSAGRHLVRARAMGLPWRWTALAIAALLALLTAFATPDWLRRKAMPLGERPDPWSRGARRRDPTKRA